MRDKPKIPHLTPEDLLIHGEPLPEPPAYVTLDELDRAKRVYRAMRKGSGPAEVMDLIVESLLREHPEMPDEQVLSLAHGIYMDLAERVAASKRKKPA